MDDSYATTDTGQQDNYGSAAQNSGYQEYTNDQSLAYGDTPPQQNHATQPMSQDWRANLPPELMPTLQKFDSVEKLAKGYADLQSMMGKKVTDFSKENWETYKAIQNDINGVPSDPSGYEIDTVEEDENLRCVLSDNDMDVLKNFCHANGLTKEQAQMEYGLWNALSLGAQYIQEQQQIESDVNTAQVLENAWGNNYEAKLNSVNNFVEKVAPSLLGCSASDIKDEVNRLGAARSPLLISLFAAIGEMASESYSRGYNNLAPMDATTRLGQLQGDPEWNTALFNRTHPRHMEVKREFDTLVKLRNGEA